LVQAKENVYAEVMREDTKPNDDVGFEEESDGDPDCKVLSVERASR
jgi:hypothetical protein